MRFSQSGRPVVRVAKELSDNVRLVRDNFTANLVNFAGEVMRDNPDEYKTQLEQANRAGLPIAQHDSKALSKALEIRAEIEAEAKAKADDAESQPEVARELVPA